MILNEVEEPGEARYDPELGAWILSRFADVSAALRDPRLSSSGTLAEEGAANVEVRDTVLGSMSPTRLAAIRAEIVESAQVLVERLPIGVPVDLVKYFARPWSMALAVRTTNASPSDAEKLDRLAREVFLAAADATSAGFPPMTQSAVAELASCFPGAAVSSSVQTYVAVSQTLPCLLANAWLELFRRPDQAEHLRAQPERIPRAVEELLRHASPARAVFRLALAETPIGGVNIALGDRVILMISRANRDLERFSGPGQVDVCRDASGHLAFGKGRHSCPGASLIRMAVAVATEALLRMTSEIELIGEVEWTGGFSIRAPESFRVVLTPSSSRIFRH